MLEEIWNARSRGEERRMRNGERIRKQEVSIVEGITLRFKNIEVIIRCSILRGFHYVSCYRGSSITVNSSLIELYVTFRGANLGFRGCCTFSQKIYTVAI